MQRLQTIRKENGYTQTQVAKELGVAQGTVAMWETGKANPRVETLQRLATLLGVTVDELLREEETP